jgi:hypothetical protein
MGFRLVNLFIDHFYIRLGTTRIYNVIPDVHTSQITTVPIMSSSSLLCLYQLFPDNGF